MIHFAPDDLDPEDPMTNTFLTAAINIPLGQLNLFALLCSAGAQALYAKAQKPQDDLPVGVSPEATTRVLLEAVALGDNLRRHIDQMRDENFDHIQLDEEDTDV